MSAALEASLRGVAQTLGLTYVCVGFYDTGNVEPFFGVSLHAGSIAAGGNGPTISEALSKGLEDIAKQRGAALDGTLEEMAS